MTRILALDIATQTGIAFAENNDTPEFSTVRLGGPGKHTHATLCAAAMRMTNRLIKQYEPDLLAIEAAYFNPKHPRAGILLYSLRGAIIGTAKINGLHAEEFTPNEIRQHFISTGSLGRVEAKQTVYDVCKMLGWDPKNNDEADAGAVLERARATEKISKMMPQGGLFRGK